MEGCGYRLWRNSVVSITATSCLTKERAILLLPCFRSLRLRPMKHIAPKRPVIQNAKQLCVTTKKRGVSLVMNVRSCGLSSSSRVGLMSLPISQTARLCYQQGLLLPPADISIWEKADITTWD